jgi:transposase
MNRSKTKNVSAWIGIDVSKAQLDIASSHPDIKLPSQLPNDKHGHQELIKIIAKNHHIKIIFEATGGYEKALLISLQERKIHATRANPAQVRAYAKAQGLLAKTDRIDACLLAKYGETFQPEATWLISPELDEIRDLLRCRRYLREQLHREKMQLEHTRSKDVTSLLKKRLKAIEKELLEITKTIIAKSRELESLRPAIEKLVSVKGVAELTAISLLVAMPELGKITRKQAAALAGVAPMNCDSGKIRGHRRIQGGRGEIRQAMYMATIVACRYEPTLKEFYQRLLANGKAKKVAITAVMRKLILHLNSLMRNHLQSLETH